MVNCDPVVFSGSMLIQSLSFVLVLILADFSKCLWIYMQSAAGSVLVLACVNTCFHMSALSQNVAQPSDLCNLIGEMRQAAFHSACVSFWMRLHFFFFCRAQLFLSSLALVLCLECYWYPFLTFLYWQEPLSVKCSRDGIPLCLELVLCQRKKTVNLQMYNQFKL